MNWRFIPYAGYDGALNMGIDVLLLEQASHNVPILRLYGFTPPCISIGLNQKLSEETVNRVLERGFDIVRRPSGGRAVLHYQDLTYSFIACEKGFGEFGVLDHSVSAAYRQICAGLQEAFAILGLRAELGSAQASYRHLADCFLATTNADLHHNGRKLAGSAQLRRKGCVLQHGSIPLQLEQVVMPELLGDSKSDMGTVERHANLFESLGRSLSFDELNDALKGGFEKAFGVNFAGKDLDEGELQQADSLRPEFDHWSALSRLPIVR